MPISRKKACSTCRDSKARCSLDLPCSRCSERGLRCAYERPAAHQGPYPSPRPVLSRPTGSSTQGADNQEPTLWSWDSIFPQQLPEPQTVSTLDPWLEPLGNQDTVLPEALSEDEILRETPMLVATNKPSGTLSQRKPNNPQTYLTSKVIFGQLTSYPKMMIDGKGRLPPFIFPQCILEGGVGR